MVGDTVDITISVGSSQNAPVNTGNEAVTGLSGKVAIVTGASKGIGAGIARAFATAEAPVVVNYASSAVDAATVVDDIVAEGGTAPRGVDSCGIVNYVD